MRTSLRDGFALAIQLADQIKSTWDPKMKWTWGEALLGYAMSRLDEYRKTDDYTPFLSAYCDYWVTHNPPVDQSDTAAPGLITYAMQKKTGKKEYAALTDRVLHYLRHEPRLIEDSVNHLGNSFIGKIYPKSIWVDSLMMFSVFPSLYAKEQNDPELLTIAARQPRVMAKYMMDPDDHLWYHSYWVKQKTHYPKKKIYWGRGNGWVVAALPMILENIGDHPERPGIIDIFQKTCQALLPLQRNDGAFETVLLPPEKTYRELSFTALVASGFLQGFRMGFLGSEYRDAGKKAFQCVADAIESGAKSLEMPEISAPTIPMPIFPYLGYKCVPRGKNWSYGLAAFLFAAIEMDRSNEARSPEQNR